MMKSVLIHILSFIVFMAGFQSSLVLVDYQVNRDFYEAHCTNKSRPDLDCHGKCQIKKHSEKDPNILQVAKFCTDYNFLPVVTDYEIKTETPALFSQQKFSTGEASLTSGYLNSEEHPPCL